MADAPEPRSWWLLKGFLGSWTARGPLTDPPPTVGA